MTVFDLTMIVSATAYSIGYAVGAYSSRRMSQHSLTALFASGPGVVVVSTLITLVLRRMCL